MSEAREVYCVKCGCVESAEEMVYVASEDAYYCTDCAEAEGLRQCDRCGGWHRDLRSVYTRSGEEEWCENCIDNHTFECEHCGELYDDYDYCSRTVNSNGWDETWCPDCVDEGASTCHECGELIDDEYAIRVAGDYYVCDSCCSQYYTECDECGEFYPNDDVYESNGYHICTDCAPYSNYWRYCEECDTYVHESNWDYDMDCCVDCVRVSRRSDNARVRSYHGDEPPMQYFGRYEGVFKGLGIELEIDKHESDASDKQHCLNELDELLGAHAYYKYDGSLYNGIEIVTLPHTIEAFYELPWEEALKICVNRGFSSHEIGTCGLHVHLSRALFGETEEIQSDNIAKLMQFYNIYWDDIIRVSRRTDEQASRWARKYPVARKTSLKKWATKKDKYHDRYMAVNVTNNATVEIRINRGTLRLQTFLATIDFVVTTALNSAKIDWADVSDDFLWLKGLKRDTLNYLQTRSAFYEPVDKYLMDYWREENEQRAAEFERQRQELAEQNAEEQSGGFCADEDLDNFDAILEMINELEAQPF